MPGRISNKKKNKRGRLAAVICACLILIAGIVLCSVYRQKSQSSGSGQDSSAGQETAAADTAAAEETQTETSETETTTKETETTTEADTESPVIWTATCIYCSVGDTLTQSDYLRYIYVSDNIDPEPSVTVDAGSVSTAAAGTCTVEYTVSDAAGNTSYAATDVIVCDDTPAAVSGFAYDEDDLYERCSAVLDSIITDEMTDLQKVFAVFYYVRNLTYNSAQSTTMEYRAEAYYFLTIGSDNCYGNACLSQVLLEMLGYDSFIITGYDMYYDEQTHYWNMVSIDGGENWYHYDSSTWVWKNNELPVCMVTEDVLLGISQRRGGIYNFVSEEYPSNDGTDLWTEETADSLGIALTG